MGMWRNFRVFDIDVAGALYGDVVAFNICLHRN
jgi:hypothetical protein